MLNVVNRIIFSSILQIWYVEVRISQSNSESPLAFEITRVDCMFTERNHEHLNENIQNQKSVYHINPKHLGTSTRYHSCSKIWTRTIYYLMLCLKIAGWVANSVDSDETSHSAPHSVPSHLGLQCLFVCVEVLWPSQPNGVMSSAVSLPNHTFTGQA